MPSGQRSWRTSAKHLASSSSPERLTRSDAGMTVRAPCVKAAADQPLPSSHQKPRATATRPHLSTPRNPRRVSQDILARIIRRRTPLATSSGSTLDRLVVEVACPDHPRCAFAKLMSWHDLLLDQAPDRRFAHVEDFGRFLERYLTAHRAFALAIRRNLAMVAQRANPRAGPAVALARCLAGAVEHGRDGLIGHLPRQHGEEGNPTGVDAPAMLADAVPRHAQGRVVAALPSNDKAERVVLDTNDNLLDQRANDPFAGCWPGARGVPGPLEISAEREQAIPVRGGQRRLGACCQCIPFILQRAHGQETLVPASLKFRRDEAVVGINGIVLPPRTGGFVARLLEGEFDLAPLLRPLKAMRLQGADRGLYAERLQTLDHFGADSAINPQAAERDAPVPAMVEGAATAVIAPGAALRAAVGDMELAAAVAAAQEAGEPRFAAPHRSAAHEALAVGVVADQTLVPLELGPANVALVVVEDQSLPGAAILAEAAHDPLAAGLDGDATAGPPKGVCAGVNRVGQHVVEGVVDGQLPGDASALAPIPDCRQRQALVAHPEVNLPNRLQLGELGKDERDRLLDTTVRILLDAVVVRLAVADRDGEEELAAAGLLLEGFERALTEERELHLAHGALHAEQKPVVRMARIVDPILIKDQRTDQAAELEQRVPVAAVAGEP